MVMLRGCAVLHVSMVLVNFSSGRDCMTTVPCMLWYIYSCWLVSGGSEVISCSLDTVCVNLYWGSTFVTIDHAVQLYYRSYWNGWKRNRKRRIFFCGLSVISSSCPVIILTAVSCQCSLQVARLSMRPWSMANSRCGLHITVRKYSNYFSRSNKINRLCCRGRIFMLALCSFSYTPEQAWRTTNGKLDSLEQAYSCGRRWQFSQTF